MATGIPLKSLATGVMWEANPAGFVTLPSGRQVFVYQRGTTTQVSVFSDQGLTSPLTQPLATGTDGSIPGYVAANQSVDFVDASSGALDQAEVVSASQAIFKDGVATRVGNTTGLTSAQIDALFTAAPPDGVILVDTTNQIYLQRSGGKWYKSAALTLIA